MKKMRLIRHSVLLTTHKYGPFLMVWSEQFVAWVAAVGIDWTKLPWAVAGATAATLKGRKDAAGVPVHKPFWEWIAIISLSTLIALAAWRDVANFSKLSPELSTIIAGLLAWFLGDWVIKKAKEQLGKDAPAANP